MNDERLENGQNETGGRSGEKLELRPIAARTINYRRNCHERH